MSARYTTVQWNHHKKVYDAIVVAAVLLWIALFFAASSLTHRADHALSPPVLAMRALGTCALALLTFVLCIGPLARLDRRFAPLLYNRRHLGVTTFLVALAHAAIAVFYYGGFGVRAPLAAVLADNRSFASVSGFPFEIFGFFALCILFVMAATSHDFWLAYLGARAWKWIHMSVYAAYTLVTLHVALGALQSERNPVYAALLVACVALVSTLHIIAGRRERWRDAHALSPRGDGWIDVCAAGDIEESRARVVCVRNAERVAIFRHEGALSAVSNVCAHQGGPLGEGRIVEGCVTCPWHGYQYIASCGRSPPPFTEKIPTHRVRLERGRVLLHPDALPPGTPVDPTREDADA